MKKGTLLKEINKHITELHEQSFNIDVSKYDISFLNKSLQKRITETHCGSAETYCTFLEQNNTEERVGNNKTFTIKLTCIIHQLCKNANIIQVNPDLDSVVFEFNTITYTDLTIAFLYYADRVAVTVQFIGLLQLPYRYRLRDLVQKLTEPVARRSQS